jgi:hypothetical protein
MEIVLIASLAINLFLIFKNSQKKKEEKISRDIKLKNDLLKGLEEAKFKNHIALYLLKRQGTPKEFSFDMNLETLIEGGKAIDFFAKKIDDMDSSNIAFENIEIVQGKNSFLDSVIASFTKYKG